MEDKFTFLKLRNFTYTLNISITILFFLILLPPVYNFLALDLINLPPKVAELTHTALFILLPWPGAIGYRRFYQGVLIKNGMTKKVAYGTVVRLLTMSVTAITFFNFSTLSGAVVGAIALSAGVISEGITSRIMSLGIMKTILGSDNVAASEELTYKKIAVFYYPLALTSLLSLGVHPIVTFFMGQSRMSLESLAVLPVINALVFIFRSIGLSYQEVGIALMGKNFRNYKHLRNFAFSAGVIVFVVLSVIAYTPLSDFWFSTVSGLTDDLTEFAKIPLRVIAFIPALSVLISWQRSMLVYARQTKSITTATVIEVSGIILVLFVGISLLDTVGALAATSAFLIGRLGANIYLSFPYKKAVTH